MLIIIIIIIILKKRENETDGTCGAHGEIRVNFNREA